MKWHTNQDNKRHPIKAMKKKLEEQFRSKSFPIRQLWEEVAIVQAKKEKLISVA
jgi:hypothetical protein